MLRHVRWLRKKRLSDEPHSKRTKLGSSKVSSFAALPNSVMAWIIRVSSPIFCNFWITYVAVFINLLIFSNKTGVYKELSLQFSLGCWQWERCYDLRSTGWGLLEQPWQQLYVNNQSMLFPINFVSHLLAKYSEQSFQFKFSNSCVCHIALLSYVVRTHFLCLSCIPISAFLKFSHYAWIADVQSVRKMYKCDFACV